PAILQIPSEDVLSLALRCGWLSLSPIGALELTHSGKEITGGADYALKLRTQLRDLMQYDPPPWAGLLKRGRKDLYVYADLNTIQCFEDAELLGDADAHVAKWWDDITAPLLDAEN